MTAKGHVLLALPLAIFGAKSFGFGQMGGALFVFLIILGALFPDIDEPKSYIGRKFWFLSWPIKGLSRIIPPLKHRGITHILMIPFSIFIVAVFFENIWLAGFAIGWLIHTIGDLITVGGIQGYFYPFWSSRKIVLLPNFLRFYTGGVAEQILIGLLACLNSYFVYALI